MAILNITYNGLSVDYAREIASEMDDRDIRRLAAEVVRSGELQGLHIANLDDRAFDGHVVDRVTTGAGKPRVYLRPKVPFGSR